MPTEFTALLTGAGGVLGLAVRRQVSTPWHLETIWRRREVAWQPRHELDLADREGVLRLWEQRRPALVIHTAVGYDDLQRDVVRATRNVAEATAAVGARIVHVSTDQVFAGDAAPYQEIARPAPVSPYGRAKAEAEDLAMNTVPYAAVVRPSVLLSLQPASGAVAWLRDALAGGKPVRLFADELRQPIGADDLARLIWEIVALPRDEAAGIWHLVGPEAISRHGLGLLLAAKLGLPVEGIRPALGAEHREVRPLDLRLRSDRADNVLTNQPRGASLWLYHRH